MSRSRLAAIRWLTAASAALAFAASGTAASAAVPAEFYGINGQFLWSTPASTWDPQLASIAGTGVQVVRVDAPWGKVEPTAPAGGVRSYDWTSLDAIAEALARHDLRWYPVLAYGTNWAATVPGPRGYMSPPRNPADYAAFVGAFADRYGSDGTFWSEHPGMPRLPVRSYEIWNEPNVERFFPDQETAPERYADLYVPAAAAIRNADPAGQLLIGGLSSVEVGSFLARMRARQAQLWSLVDAISYHPYGGNTRIAYERIGSLRRALVELGVGDLPIEITETGWASPPSSEEHRVALMRKLAEELPRSDCGITRFIPYTWLTTETGTDPEQWFGIANADGSLKPAGAAFKGAVLRMRGIAGAAPEATVGGCALPTPAPTPTPAPAVPPPTPALAVAPVSADAPRTPPRLDAPRTAPRLSLRLNAVVKKAPRLWVAVRCSAPCRMRLHLIARSKRAVGARAVARRTLGRRVTRGGVRRKVLRMRLPLWKLQRVRRRGLRLVVHARAADGAHARMTRRVRVLSEPRRLGHRTERRRHARGVRLQ